MSFQSNLFMKEKKKNVWEERKRRNIQEGYNGRK
ncbi:hypothetical protein RUMTOR_01793 [[Ruminococcus] torques ATCC 27756]|uniref:Uncharacterized protein n=1 Tax=[Ruminococcus] torques ATCC 27756 TaxID=411460 RepID=A5KNG8_9FIRM|nr:hypothetical protein RUMTOR_01793 [[Ruminococcus] torques ATCC 27756]